MAEGTYVGTTLSIVESTHVYGGFIGTEESREQRNWSETQTIIDGGSEFRCVYSEYIPVNGATLDGFTVRNGYVNNEYGGGMLNLSSSPTITNCTFANNYAVAGNAAGGGMANLSSSPIVERCTFTGNSASAINGGCGGGMYNSDSAPIVDNCTFSTNTSNAEHTDGRDVPLIVKTGVGLLIPARLM